MRLDVIDINILVFIFNIMRMKFTFCCYRFYFNMLLTASCSSNIHGDLNFTISLEEGDDATSCVYNIINKLSYDAAATISFEKVLIISILNLLTRNIVIFPITMM